MSTSVTFVSAFIDIGSAVKSSEHRIRLFKHLADSGIPIHLFLSMSFIEKYYEIVGECSNVCVEPIELSELETFKELADVSYTIPKSSNPEKDTAAYHIVQNAKIEFVERARRIYDTTTTHYAWIDFNICQMFRNVPECVAYLRDRLRLDAGLYMPGCWYTGTGQDNLFTSINWRFCGSFFIGDAASILNFYTLYRAHFKKTVLERRILTWEVNIWHYLELTGDFRPIWYAADHDDCIIRV